MGVVADDLDGDGRIDLFHTNFLNEANTLLPEPRRRPVRRRDRRGRTSTPRAAPMTGFGAGRARRRQRRPTSTSSSPTATSTTSPGSTARWPSRRSCSWAGTAAGSTLAPAPRRRPTSSRPVVGRGVAAGDLDNDGRVDLVVVHRDAPAALLRNTHRGRPLAGPPLARDALGPDPRRGPRRPAGPAAGRSVRWLTSGTSYLSANDPRLWFGLGPAATVERLEVRWPSGLVQSWSDLPADRILDLREGDNPARSEYPSFLKCGRVDGVPVEAPAEIGLPGRCR